MPRYFFTFTDKSVPPPEDGLDLADLEAAIVVALRLVQAAASRQSSTTAGDTEVAVEIADDSGKLLFTVVNTTSIRPEP